MREWRENLRGYWERLPVWLRWSLPILIILSIILILIIVPMLQVPSACLSPKERFDIEDAARKTLAQILGGCILLIGIFLTWWRITLLERQVQIAQEGQITERFTRTIEQLGSDKLEVRLGGIYALERIAQDSEKDHWPIMEVLTAYVRERAPWREEDQPQPERPSDEPKQPIKPPPDIQAILTVIGRRRRTYGKGEDQSLDLRNTDLRGADLNKVNLERAILEGAHLEGAWLGEAHLKGAWLGEAHLEGAQLRGEANLEGAILTRAHLEGAWLDKAHLEGARLWEAHLERAILIRAHLEGADLSAAHLKGADFSKAHLEGADLRGAMGLTQEQIDSAIIDENTKLPGLFKEARARQPQAK